MRYTKEIEAQILAQIEATPEAPIVLPDWCYWENQNQPMIYINRKPVQLMRHLYELVIGPLDPEAGLVVKAGVDRRNVNPHLATVTERRGARSACKKGHEYTEADLQKDGRHRCHICYEAKLVGRPSPPALNKAKTHCPKGHEYTKENTVRLASGRRRCKQCHREEQARYMARRSAMSDQERTI